MIEEEKLKNAFQVVLRLPENANYQELAFARTEGWDSIAHMQLVAAIEQAYGIMLETRDVLALSSYSAAKNIVEKNVVKTSK